MSTFNDPSPEPTKSTYVLDANDPAEIIRLVYQDQLLTQHLGGLFPEQPDLSHLSHVHDLLDVACGPGSWALQVAKACPWIAVTGIDLNTQMILYAHAHALLEGLPNAHFQLMDALKPLDFPGHAFDVVNARLLQAFMLPEAWPRLLQECVRITRPGGSIRLTEAEYSLSNSPAFEHIGALCTQALKVVGQSFSPDGRHVGITPLLGRFLLDAGCHNIRHFAAALDYSAGMPAHDIMYQNVVNTLQSVQSFLIRCGLTTQEAITALYQQALQEMRAAEFCAIEFFLTVRGERP